MDRSFGEFLAMGHYASYVWTSYAAWLIVIGLNIWSARRALSDARRQARRRLAMREQDPSGDGE